MVFIFIPILCGTHNYNRSYDRNPKHYGLNCPHCHNNSVFPIKRREFFTVWFVPVIPLRWGKQLYCSICDWRQDFRSEDQLERMLQPSEPELEPMPQPEYPPMRKKNSKDPNTFSISKKEKN